MTLETGKHEEVAGLRSKAADSECFQECGSRVSGGAFRHPGRRGTGHSEAIMTVSLAVYIFICVMCGFVVKGLAGFGDPLIYNPLLSMRLDNKSISPAMLPVSVVLNASIAWQNRKSFSLKNVLIISVWVMAGVIPGTMLLKVGTSWVLKVILGLLIIFLGVEMLTRDKAKEMKPNPVFRAFISFCSGISAGLFGIDLLFLIYLERSTKEREEFRGSACFVFLLENTFRLIVYICSGIFTGFAVQLTLIATPAAFAGMFIGGRIDRHIDNERIHKIIIAVFIIGGVSTFLKALLLKS